MNGNVHAWLFHTYVDTSFVNLPYVLLYFFKFFYRLFCPVSAKSGIISRYKICPSLCLESKSRQQLHILINLITSTYI